MADKRILVVDADVARKIDDNRGEMGRSDFLNLLIDAQLNEGTVTQNSVNREEFQQFQQGIKELLRNFLEFFLSYGLELGRKPENKTFEELSKKLQALGRDSEAHKL